MYIVAYRNTMAGARMRARETERPMSLAELKQLRAREDAAAAARRKAVSDAKLTEQRAIANAAIRRANERARKFNGTGKSLDDIAQRLCTALGVSRAELAAEGRGRRVILARQAVMYWACRLTTLSTPDLGRRLGRDHTTVLHGKDAYRAKRLAMGRHLRAVR